MVNVRVFQLARDLNLPSQEVIDRLKKLGMDVKTASSSVDEDTADKLKRALKIDALTSRKKRIYGSEDGAIAEGASFAVENWAAAGFWQEIEDGLLKIKQTRIPKLRLAFFTWHNRVEGQHACHTMEELEEVYFSDAFNREKFFQGAREVVEAIAVFWDGLEEDRKKKMYM